MSKVTELPRKVSKQEPDDVSESLKRSQVRHIPWWPHFSPDNSACSVGQAIQRRRRHSGPSSPLSWGYTPAENSDILNPTYHWLETAVQSTS